MRDTQHHQQHATGTDAFRVLLTLESQLFVPKQLFYFTGQGLHAEKLLTVRLDQQMLEYMQSGAKSTTSSSFQLA